MDLKFQVQTRIQKPIDEVFDGVVNPKKLSGYFVREASGPLAEGSRVKWLFPEFEDEVFVDVKQVVRNERITFAWGAEGGAYDTRVDVVFKPLGNNATLLQISESGWQDTETGRNASYGNCGGWMHMSMCLKAYLEHGINLRVGSVHVEAHENLTPRKD